MENFVRSLKEFINQQPWWEHTKFLVKYTRKLKSCHSREVVFCLNIERITHGVLFPFLTKANIPNKLSVSPPPLLDNTGFHPQHPLSARPPTRQRRPGPLHQPRLFHQASRLEHLCLTQPLIHLWGKVVDLQSLRQVNGIMKLMMCRKINSRSYFCIV